MKREVVIFPGISLGCLSSRKRSENIKPFGSRLFQKACLDRHDGGYREALQCIASLRRVDMTLGHADILPYT